MKERLIIGLMSGTSVDAIDAAVVRVGGRANGRYSARVLRHMEFPWPAEIRRRLLAVMAPAQTTTQEICDLNVAVAERFAVAALAIMRLARLHTKDIAAIGSHGQTICHLPIAAKSKTKNQKSKIGSTLQIGDPSVIATLTGIPTVGNFRPADMAVGGQGAPLVPFADAMLLTDPKKTRCVQNIGGIANVTFLPAGNAVPRTAAKRVIAFDTGPGNMVMDAVVAIATRGRQRFDRNGQLAAAGKLDEALFRRLKKHPYFKRRPPKSTGREEFGQAFARGLLNDIKNGKSKTENLIHTLARFTAWSVAHAYAQFLPQAPDEVILCGGGADNPVLARMLAEEFRAMLPATPAIRLIEEFGIPNKAKEAASFALLAAATLDGVPGNLPSVTGARRAVVLGLMANP